MSVAIGQEDNYRSFANSAFYSTIADAWIDNFYLEITGVGRKRLTMSGGVCGRSQPRRHVVKSQYGKIRFSPW